MKQLKVKSRLVLLDNGQVVNQVYVSKADLAKRVNHKVTLKVGWYSLGVGPECPIPKPAPLGVPGDWFCVGSQWVWFDA